MKKKIQSIVRLIGEQMLQRKIDDFSSKFRCNLPIDVWFETSTFDFWEIRANCD